MSEVSFMLWVTLGLAYCPQRSRDGMCRFVYLDVCKGTSFVLCFVCAGYTGIDGTLRYLLVGTEKVDSNQLEVCSWCSLVLCVHYQ